MLQGILHTLHPLLVPTCFLVAWLVTGSLIWSLWSAIRDAVSNAKALHEIPCANCRFFTNTHVLKCPVHPTTALSMDAINCLDYEQVSYGNSSNFES